MPFLKKHKIPKWSTQVEERTLKNGLRHTVFNSNGDTVYVGEWSRNKKSGKGTQIVKDKWVYEGDWLNGMRHGYGIFSRQLENKIRVLIYEGEWQNDIPHEYYHKHQKEIHEDLEYGVYEYNAWTVGKQERKNLVEKDKDSKSNIVGYVERDTGFGTRHYKDGSIYEGEWLDGKRSGKGRMWFADNSFYEGDWWNDAQGGKGLFVFPNGNRYEGDWFKGKKQGKGIYYHLRTGQKQEGIWIEDIARVSQITDIQYRQTALEPTPYPIVKNKLQHINQLYNDTELSARHSCMIFKIFQEKEL